MDVIVSGVEHKLCFCKPVDESAGGQEQINLMISSGAYICFSIESMLISLFDTFGLTFMCECFFDCKYAQSSCE